MTLVTDAALILIGRKVLVSSVPDGPRMEAKCSQVVSREKIYLWRPADAAFTAALGNVDTATWSHVGILTTLGFR